MDGFATGRTAGPRMLVTVLLVTALAMTAGCGSDDKQSARAPVTTSRAAELTPIGTGRFGYARGLFNEMCAGCHALADAGARGNRLDLDRVPDLEGARVWRAIRNGAPGMPGWRAKLSFREIGALAVYVMNVAERSGGEGRRSEAEVARWSRLAVLVERELDREGRKNEQRSGRVVAPQAE